MTACLLGIDPAINSYDYCSYFYIIRAIKA